MSQERELPLVSDIQRWFQLWFGKGEDAMYKDMEETYFSKIKPESISDSEPNLENMKNWQSEVISYCDKLRDSEIEQMAEEYATKKWNEGFFMSKQEIITDFIAGCKAIIKMKML